jgi:hypothetical protein
VAERQRRRPDVVDLGITEPVTPVAFERGDRLGRGRPKLGNVVETDRFDAVGCLASTTSEPEEER